MDEPGRLQRLGSRALSGLGLTRKRHVRHMMAELEALQSRVAHLQGQLERSEQHSGILAGRLQLHERYLNLARSELQFRADRLCDFVEGRGDRHRHGCGFLQPEVRLVPARPGRGIFVKRLFSRPFISGLTARQAFHLEVLCLSRLQDRQGRGAAHFPAVVAINADSFEIVQTDQGHSLDNVPPTDRPAIAARLRDSFRDQLARIVETMDQAGVVHLDMHASGRNVTVDNDGRLSLIDFDIATVDDVPFSALIARRHAEWVRNGRHAGTLPQLTGLVERFLRPVS